MFLFKKRYAALAIVLAGLGYGSQFYTISGWQHLQIRPVASSQNENGNTSLRSGLADSHQAWTVQGTTASNVGHSNHSIQSNSSVDQTINMRISQPTTSSPKASQSTTRMVSTDSGRLTTNQPTVRIASFNLQSFGETKLNKLAVVEIIARVVRQFDVVAIQHISSRAQDVLPLLVDKINQSDRRYDFCIGPRVGSESHPQQFAFIFDTDTIETDRYQLYTVDDPQNLMEYDPLVGWFRSRGAPKDKAFTFTLVNVRIDSLQAEREVQLLPDLIRSVRQDGRNEDDVILIGDFCSSDTKLGSLRKLGMLFGLEGVSTTVSGDDMLDNIVFPARATDEFTGRAGTIDFLRQFNLSLDQAFQISNHMPVWSEFFAFEGGAPGYVQQ